MNAKDINDLLTRLLHIAVAGAAIYIVGCIILFILFFAFAPRLLNWMMRRMDV